MSDTPTPEISTLAPPTLDHLVGQKAAVERLRVAVAAAFADGQAMSHFLFCGPAGTGKTLMANILAREMGAEFREVLAQTVNADGSLPALLLECRDRDVLFLDELHLLDLENQTLLYGAMAERRLFVQSSRRQSRSLPLSQFTLLGATTDEHDLLPPFRDRFITVHFDYYTPSELVALLEQRATAATWEVGDGTFEWIAELGRGTPRIALKLLSAARQVCRSEGGFWINALHVKRVCELEGLDPVLGLNRLERRVLLMLDEAGGPVRLNVLASRLGLPPKTVSHVVEDFLIRQGLIDKQADGRVLTAKGIAFLRGQLSESFNIDGHS